MTDLSLWGKRGFTDNSSLRAVAKRTLDRSRSALDVIKCAILIATGNGSASILPHPFGAAVMILAFCASMFCAVGYVHYKYTATDERLAAERAERANADLQDALDRLRAELVATKSRADAPRDNGKRQAAESERERADLIARLTRRLDAPRDLQLPAAQPGRWAVRLSLGSKSDSHLDQDQINLRQLSAERDKVVGERDQLLVRVRELEQKLMLLQSRRGLRPLAGTATVSTTSPDQAPAEAAGDSSPRIAGVSARDHSRQVAVICPDKNFTSPSWVPNSFSNESASVRGPAAQNGR